MPDQTKNIFCVFLKHFTIVSVEKRTSSKTALKIFLFFQNPRSKIFCELFWFVFGSPNLLFCQHFRVLLVYVRAQPEVCKNQFFCCFCMFWFHCRRCTWDDLVIVIMSNFVEILFFVTKIVAKNKMSTFSDIFKPSFYIQWFVHCCF